uniref:Prostaglandin D2 receptor n=1 Tax=Pelusios castaneus TaxID=367368 RepID=A0A8C8RQS9_9SAUR
METDGYRCWNRSTPEGGKSALPSSLLFGTGMLGNLLALLLLGCQRRRGGRASAFALLVSGLAVTDLLGKCLVSPIVLAAYARNRSLSQLWPAAPGEPGPGPLCQLFAALMAFFGLAPTLALLAMALEVWLSLAHPYFYRRHVRRRRPAAGLALLGAAGLCALFCALPPLGLFGAAVQYCPGTWCFARMAGPAGRYAAVYAGLLGALGLAVGACNAASMRSLLRMARRPHRPRAPGPARMEERDHLVLLGLMTVLFAVCCLPLIVSSLGGRSQRALGPSVGWGGAWDCEVQPRPSSANCCVKSKELRMRRAIQDRAPCY